MSSQLSYRLHGREQRPKTLRKHYRDELDTGQVKDLGQRAESLFRKAVGDGPQSVKRYGMDIAKWGFEVYPHRSSPTHQPADHKNASLGPRARTVSHSRSR
jgi:hypothetical protein